MELLQRRETIIRQWFSMWLTGQNSGLENIFSPDATYVESWGPEYHGIGAIKFWFEEWNTRGTVQQWDIPSQSFDGLSLIRWDQEEKIGFLQEFGCNDKRYDPYADGPVPVFRDEPALWL